MRVAFGATQSHCLTESVRQCDKNDRGLAVQALLITHCPEGVRYHMENCSLTYPVTYPVFFFFFFIFESNYT